MTCYRCNDTKKYLGVGMTAKDCELCAEQKDISPVKTMTLPKINRNDHSYRKAIKDMMSLDTSLSREQAVKLFEDEYYK